MSTSVTTPTSQATRPSARDRVSGLGDRWDRWWRSTPGWQRALVYVVLVLIALVLPWQGFGKVMTPQSDWPSTLFYPIGIYVLLAVGLNIVVGYAGLLDLGYVAFYAIGAYTTAILTVDHGWSFWECVPIAILVTMTAGVLLGAPTLRLRGDYLAIVTLGFGEIIRVTANNLDFTGGPRGIAGIPNPPAVPGLENVEIAGIKPFQYGVLDARPYYYLLLFFLVLVIILVKRLERSRVGRAWAAIREDEDAAELMGVPTLKFKLWAFAMGAAVGSVAGTLYASKSIAILPDNFQFQLSALILAAVVLGGSGNVPGVMLGAFLIAWLPERFRQFAEFRTLIFGAALVIIMIFRPEGLLPSRQRRAELEEGGGGMGHLGGEVGAEMSQTVEVEEVTE
jgi:branched-chain amino acid transport system permease protein